jgi:hypothetical protein
MSPPTSAAQNKLEIELLKKDVSVITGIFTKFDVTIEKLEDIANSLGKVAFIQEQRIEAQENATKEIHNILEARRVEHREELKDIYAKISEINHELSNKIREGQLLILEELKKVRDEVSEDKKEDKTLLDRIAAIEGWKWMLTGVFAVVVWLLSRIDISQFFV